MPETIVLSDQDNEYFDPYRKEPLKEEDFKDAEGKVEEYRDRIYDRAQIGADFAGYMSRLLSRTDFDQPGAIERVGRYFRNWETILGQREFSRLRSGFLAETATKYGLSELFLDVRYATPKQDMIDKVDFWLDLGSEENLQRNTEFLMVQVKALPLKPGTIDYVLHPIRSQKELVDLTAVIFDANNWLRGPGGIERRSNEDNDFAEQSDKFFRNNRILLEKGLECTNAEAAIAILPSLGSDESPMHIVTGRPAIRPGQEISDLARQLNRDLNTYYRRKAITVAR